MMYNLYVIEYSFLADSSQIRSSRLITSYAISPQAVNSCAPCSVRCHSSSNEPAHRYTYCSVSLLRPRILGFAEECPRGGASGKISTFSVDVRIPSRVIYLDIIQLPTDKDRSASDFRVLAIHENAKVTCYDLKLQKEEWAEYSPHQSRAGQQEQETALVQYATCLSTAEARKGILRERDDVRAALSENPEAASLLLCLSATPLFQDSANLKLSVELFSIQNSDKVSRTHLKLLKILSQDINPPQMHDHKQCQFSYHAASATLYQQTAKAVYVYDLSELISRPKHIIQPDYGDIASCLRISACLLATLTACNINLIALPYCSLQGSKTLPSKSRQANDLVAQKDPKHLPAGARLCLLSYSAQYQTLVALNGSRLVATSISEAFHKNNLRKRKRDGLLISSLGKGSSTSQLIYQQKFSNSASKLLGRPLTQPGDHSIEASRLVALDGLLRQDGPKAFDEAIMSELRSDQTKHPRISHQQISYILTKMFKLSSIEANKDRTGRECHSLRVSLWLRQTSQWLLAHGFLTLSRIESAFKHNGTLPITSELAHSALIIALTTYDPSLSLLSTALASPIPLSPEDLAHALAVVTRQSVDSKASSTQNFLTNGEIPLEDDGQDNMRPFHDTRTYGPAVYFGGSVPQNSELNQRILSLVLGKLYSYPSFAVTSALRDAFSTLELHSLVDLLRIEIASNGWLSLYENDFSTTRQEGVSNDQLMLVSHILNSVLDALGPAGWMLASSSAEVLTECTDVISYLKVEVSAALEGVEETTYLKGMLGEMLLCGKESLHPRSRKALTDSGSQNPKIELANPKSFISKDKGSEMLPLGLKIKPAFSVMKVGAGGELMTRSRRDIGRLKSKMVGEYSFERIVI